MRRLLILVFSTLVVALTAGADGKIPRPSPEYAFHLPNGEQVLLSQYRGKVVLLMFVATTCPHCQQACRFIEGLAKEYGPKGFQPLAVAFNDMAVMLVPDFIRQGNLTFPVGYDSRDPVFAYIERSPMLRTYVPIFTFIDRRGSIRGQYLGDDDFFKNQENNIRGMVEKLLNERGGR